MVFPNSCYIYYLENILAENDETSIHAMLIFFKRLIFQRNFILKQCRLVFRLNQYTYENSQSGYIHLPKLSDRSGPCISGVVEPRFGLAFGRLVTRPQSTKPGTLLLTVRHGVN